MLPAFGAERGAGRTNVNGGTAAHAINWKHRRIIDGYGYRTAGVLPGLKAAASIEFLVKA